MKKYFFIFKEIEIDHFKLHNGDLFHLEISLQSKRKSIIETFLKRNNKEKLTSKHSILDKQVIEFNELIGPFYAHHFKNYQFVITLISNRANYSSVIILTDLFKNNRYNHPGIYKTCLELKDKDLSLFLPCFIRHKTSISKSSTLIDVEWSKIINPKKKK